MSLTLKPAVVTPSIDLVTLSFAEGALSELNLDTGQLAFLPSAITAVSKIIIRTTGDRDFIQQTYDSIFPVQLDGSVYLRQLPVNWVSRVSAGRTNAILIQNTDSANNQRATVAFTTTGDVESGLSYPGLDLTVLSNGTQTTQQITFASNPTLNALAAAIAGLGGGWTATITSGYGPWASTELITDDVPAQGALIGTTDGATFDVWGTDLDGHRLERRTGILRLGDANVLGIDGPRWGPGWEIFANETTESFSKVRVVYNAGFATVPLPIQTVCALAVKSMVEQLVTDSTLASESDGAYSWDRLAADAVDALPPSCRQILWTYTLHHP